MSEESEQKQRKRNLEAELLSKIGSIARRQAKVRANRTATFARAKSLPDLRSRLDPSSPVGTYVYMQPDPGQTSIVY
jgi:hypothetical protein